MKRLAYLLIFLICSVGCISNEIGLAEDIPDLMEIHDIERAIQVSQDAFGQTSMAWLNDLLTKAEEDRRNKTHKGSYIGFVSLVTYENNRLFYTNFMAMVGGGRMFHLFDCQGNHFDASSFVAEDPAFFPKEAKKKENVIYSSAPLEFFD